MLLSIEIQTIRIFEARSFVRITTFLAPNNSVNTSNEKIEMIQENEKYISKHLAAMKFYTEINNQTLSTKSELRRKRLRNEGGSMKLRRNIKTFAPVQNRSSSVGIFPGSGIGSGIIPDYHGMSQKYVTTPEEKQLKTKCRYRLWGNREF